jgi:hypothetical protein
VFWAPCWGLELIVAPSRLGLFRVCGVLLLPSVFWGSQVAAVVADPIAREKELLHRFNMGRGTVVQRVERAAERVFSERTANKNTRERIRGIRSAHAW